jgi:hypothetical protein
MMFSVFCPTHDTRVLMTRRNVLGFSNSTDGPVIKWKCNCGHEGFLDRNGTAADCTDCDAGTTVQAAGRLSRL